MKYQCFHWVFAGDKPACLAMTYRWRRILNLLMPRPPKPVEEPSRTQSRENRLQDSLYLRGPSMVRIDGDVLLTPDVQSGLPVRHEDWEY
jgi:hypothetical protein